MGYIIFAAVGLGYLLAVNLISYGAIAPWLSAGRFIAAVAVVSLYARAILDAARKHRGLNGVDGLLIGIGLTWLAWVAFSASNEFSRAGVPGLSFNMSAVLGGFGVVMLLGAAYHLTAPGFTTWPRTLAALAAGVVAYLWLRVIVGLF